MKQIDIFKLILTLSLFGCSQSPDSVSTSPGSEALPTEVGNGHGMPTEVGNGVQNNLLLYTSERYGVSIQYEASWRIQRELEQTEIVIFQKPNDRIRFDFQSLKGFTQQDALRKLNIATSGDGKTYSTLKIGNRTFYRFENRNNELVTFDQGVMIKIEFESEATLRLFVARMVVDNPECSEFKEGQWIKYRNLDKDDFTTGLQVLRIQKVHPKKEIVDAILEPNSGDGFFPIKCRGATSLVSGNIAAQVTRLRIDLNIEISWKNRKVKTVRTIEEFIAASRRVGQQIYLVTYFSELVPALGILQQEIVKGKAGFEKDPSKATVIERLVFDSAGFGEPTTSTTSLPASRPRQNALTNLTDEIIELAKLKSPRAQFKISQDFLEASQPQFAVQIFDHLSKRIVPDSLKAEIEFGRAFLKLMVLFDKPEYQELLQRLGYPPYSLARQFFGASGLLKFMSEMPNKQYEFEGRIYEDQRMPCDLYREKQVPAHLPSLLPFHGHECKSEEDQEGPGFARLLTRTDLTIEESLEYAKILDRDLEEIALSLESASSDRNLRFILPSSFHFGHTQYVFYAAEAALMAYFVRNIQGHSRLVMAYEWPQITYADYAEFLTVYFHPRSSHAKALQKAGLKVESAESYYDLLQSEALSPELERRRKLQQEFQKTVADKINARFLSLKSKESVHRAAESFGSSARNYIRFVDLVLDEESMTLYKSATIPDRILRQSQLAASEVLKSLEEGEVVFTSHEMHPRVNLKKFFEEPLDTKTMELGVLFNTGVNADGRWEVSYNEDFERRAMRHLSADADRILDNEGDEDWIWVREKQNWDSFEYDERYSKYDIAKKSIQLSRIFMLPPLANGE